MSRPPLPERSLAAVDPELAAQLHPTRNGATTADTVSAASAIRLWWACPRGHEWQTGVKDRARSTGCPACTGRLPTPDTCLAACNPALAGQWHPTRNGALTPADVLPSSNRRVWWQCPSGHAWATQVTARTRGTGCPDCSRPQPAPTLLTGRPDLAAQWDTTVNGDLTPAVTAGSKRRVRWRCENGHQWLARIDSRSSGAGCPVCAGRVTTPDTAFGVRYPHLRDEWAGDLNGNLDPATVGPGVSRRVWWRCPTDPRHLWRAEIVDRARGTGCPYCDHKRPTPATCLAAAAPHLLGDWHPERNGALSPTDVLPHSGTPVWWQCPEYHEWAASPANRLTGTGHGCPDCAAAARPPVTGRRTGSTP